MGVDPRERTEPLHVPLPPRLPAVQGFEPTQLLDPPKELVAIARTGLSAEALITPDRAMLFDEARRLRVFSGYLAVLCGLLVPTLLLLHGDPVAKAMHLGA